MILFPTTELDHVASLSDIKLRSKKPLVNRIVESLVCYHPDMTQRERAESAPIIAKMFLISLGTMLSVIGLLVYLFAF
ncbi:hypothetical protein ACFSUS_12770 [Spirosoma soli]|uniref:Uncharacterized protein n=1 Tax=Spirosoma soli TaxID=1770529 RepID=A0ABW5M5B1_9BACT